MRKLLVLGFVVALAACGKKKSNDPPPPQPSTGAPIAFEAKSFKAGNSRVTLSAEAFNLFNAATELKRINDFSSSAYRRLDEILAPRIIRFGARVAF